MDAQDCPEFALLRTQTHTFVPSKQLLKLPHQLARIAIALPNPTLWHDLCLVVDLPHFEGDVHPALPGGVVQDRVELPITGGVPQDRVHLQFPQLRLRNINTPESGRRRAS